MKKFLILFALILSSLCLYTNCFAFSIDKLDEYLELVYDDFSGDKDFLKEYPYYTLSFWTVDNTVNSAYVIFSKDKTWITYDPPAASNINFVLSSPCVSYTLYRDSLEFSKSTSCPAVPLPRNTNYYNYELKYNRGVEGVLTFEAKPYSVVEDFFKEPPPPQTPLVETVEGLEMSKVLQEIVGLLPTILIILASLVGLRKAWTFLCSVLKAS